MGKVVVWGSGAGCLLDRGAEGRGLGERGAAFVPEKRSWRDAPALDGGRGVHSSLGEGGKGRVSI
ncbi:hypothetical protein Acsp01_04370 [Actinoplanes sp. NBRC 101535]|nr:hypothetical protein Acsp01_04370 [Actinoplanes sp. NBRC 101535]